MDGVVVEEEEVVEVVEEEVGESILESGVVSILLSFCRY